MKSKEGKGKKDEINKRILDGELYKRPGKFSQGLLEIEKLSAKEHGIPAEEWKIKEV